MKLSFDANAHAPLLREHIDFMRRAASHERHVGLHTPSVRTQDFGEKLLKAKSGRAERKDRTLHRVACRNRHLFLFFKELECTAIDILGRHERFQLMEHLREDARAARRRCTSALERALELYRIEALLLPVRFCNKNGHINYLRPALSGIRRA